MQTGDDSPLKNIWDEISVQVQDEESPMWEFYLDIISSLIRNELKPLDAETEQSIWLQTDEGIDRANDIEWEKGNGEEDIPDTIEIDKDDITKYILQEYALSIASDWTNKQIKKYLDGGLEF